MKIINIIWIIWNCDLLVVRNHMLTVTFSFSDQFVNSTLSFLFLRIKELSVEGIFRRAGKKTSAVKTSGVMNFVDESFVTCMNNRLSEINVPTMLEAFHQIHRATHTLLIACSYSHRQSARPHRNAIFVWMRLLDMNRWVSVQDIWTKKPKFFAANQGCFINDTHCLHIWVSWTKFPLFRKLKQYWWIVNDRKRR